jgi:hypothetical protein
MRTSELQGVALDWAVSNAGMEEFGFVVGEFYISGEEAPYHPSTNWSQGGPIIEREKIGVDCDDQGVWFASYDLSAETAWGATGPTPLIAAMRCYVASKLGDEVEIPEEV